MRTGPSPICLATGAIRRSNSSPSARSMISGPTASRRPALSVGKWPLSAWISWLCCFTSGSFGCGEGVCGASVVDLASLALGRDFGLGGSNLGGDVLGVVLDPAEEGRPARVLPRKAEEVEARHLGHPSTVLHAAI